MADGLAAAAEGLRARAQSAPLLPEAPGEAAAESPWITTPRAPQPPASASAQPAGGAAAASAPAPEAPAAAGAPAPVTEPPLPAPEAPVRVANPAPAPIPLKPRNKHSQSLIGRLRNRRKQRRAV